MVRNFGFFKPGDPKPPKPPVAELWLVLLVVASCTALVVLLAGVHGNG